MLSARFTLTLFAIIVAMEIAGLAFIIVRG